MTAHIVIDNLTGVTALRFRDSTTDILRRPRQLGVRNLPAPSASAPLFQSFCFPSGKLMTDAPLSPCSVVANII